MSALVSSRMDSGTTSLGAPRSLLLVGPLPPPSGGMANQTRQLAQLLAGEGCIVIVVQVNAPYRPHWIRHIRGARALFRLIPYLVRLWDATGRADLVHVMANSGWAWHLFAAPAIWIAHVRSKPVVVNYRGGDADAFFARHFRWVRATLACANRVIVPSEFLARVFEKYGVGSTVVPNVVNLDAFHPPVSPPASPHLIVTRNLEPVYDIETAISAFSIVIETYPDARLTVAGSGPSLSQLKKLTAELGVAHRVRFTGQLDNAVVPELYRSASVLINSSLVDNMPISLLEAMASGIPIVSTNVGGIPFLVEDERTALLVPPGDPVTMAAATVRLIRSPQLAAKLGKAGQEAVQRYAWRNVRGGLFDVYASAGDRASANWYGL